MRTTSYLTGVEADVQPDPSRNMLFVEDPICGPYAFGAAVKATLEADIWKKRRTAWWLATRWLRGERQPKLITEGLMNQSPTGLERWSPYQLDQILAECPQSPTEFLDGALLNLTERLQHPSEIARVAPEQRWELYAFDDESLGYVLRQLIELGYLRDAGGEPASSYRVRRYQIHAKGWERLAQLRQPAIASSKQAFVAMWFSDQTEALFAEAIRPAIEACGNKCVRIDRKEHNNKICDEIVAEIRKSRFVVADFTGQRGGVYFEAGLAQGLGLPVIWTVHRDHLQDVHFDTRQYNHIVYEDSVQLREKLEARIHATIAG